VGIDFGARGVKLLQLRQSPGKLTVLGAAKLDIPLTSVPNLPKAGDRPANGTAAPKLPAVPAKAPLPMSSEPSRDGERLGQQLREVIESGGFKGNRCVVSLAREDVCVQSIRLPRMPDDELRQTAAWEASQRFGFERTAMEVDFIRTGAVASAGQGQDNREEVILVATPHVALNARLEGILQAGLRPVAVETCFTAAVRALSRKVRREADRNTIRAIVEIGSSGSVVLITRGDQIAFCKPIGIGGNSLNRAVAEHLQMDESAAAELRGARITAAATGQTIHDLATDRAVFEAVRPLMGDLVKEVTLCLRYYGVTFRGSPPEVIILTGGDGLEPRLGEIMNKSCKIAVAYDDATATLTGLITDIRNHLNRAPGQAGSWAVAAGLSLRGLGRRQIRRDDAKAAQAALATREAAA